MEELIFTKAKQLFFSYGLKNVSMDDLAKLASVSKKTIYQHYSDKNELLNKIIDELIKSHEQLLADTRLSSENAIDEVLKQSDKCFNTWSSINQNFFHELEKFLPIEWAKLELHKQKVLVPAIIRNLERGIQETVFRADINIAFVADLRLQQLTTALHPKTFTKRNIASSELIYNLTEFYLHGLATEKGKKILNKYLIERDEK